MPGISVFPPPGTIKLIQAGAISVASGTTSNTATISSVNVNKSILGYTGTSAGQGFAGRLTLTNATTITSTIVDPGTGIATVTGYYLTEYY